MVPGVALGCEVPQSVCLVVCLAGCGGDVLGVMMLSSCR